SLRPLAEMALAPPADAEAAPAPDVLPSPGPAFPHRVVLVDGVFAPHLAAAIERAPSLVARHLELCGHDAPDALQALNEAALADGFVLALEAGVVLETPIHILHLAWAAAAASQPRNLVLLGPGARASLAEQHCAAGSGAYFANGVTDIVLAEG